MGQNVFFDVISCETPTDMVDILELVVNGIRDHFQT